jgi:hypothetical protein
MLTEHPVSPLLVACKEADAYSDGYPDSHDSSMYLPHPRSSCCLLQALTAPLPVGWSEHQDTAGNVFFFNKVYKRSMHVCMRVLLVQPVLVTVRAD